MALMSKIGKFAKLVITAVGMVAAISASQAVPLISGMGGPAGFGTLTQQPNDDGSSNLLNLPFEVNFFGNRYNNFYVNNNGNVTFNGPVGTYTPSAFPISSQPMIAPYWGDVDTRCSTCGAVYIGSPNASTVVVTWNNVGFYNSNSSLTNNFQLALRDQGAGNFDVEFRYDRLSWTTGNASGGVNGLGGTPAQAGYDAGNGTNFFTLPGSRTAGVLNLANATNVTGGTPGLWSYAIREGALPGETPSNPLQPVVVNGSFLFDFNVIIPTRRIFIDPVVAVGYNYVVSSAQRITSVQFTTNLGDPNGYEIRDLAGNLLAVVNVNDIYNFTTPVSGFRVTGIEASAGLNPLNTNAFVTGLTFDTGGQVQMSQTPITLDTGGGPNNVPLPGSLVLLAVGGLAFLRKIRG
jgi:Nidogen-like